MGRGIELATGYVTLAVTSNEIAPVIAAQFGDVEKRVAPRAGRAIGKAMARGFEAEKPDLDAMTADYQRAQDQVVAAEKRATSEQEGLKRKVEIAQAKLNETTKRYGSDSSQALTSADRLSLAEQKLESSALAAADNHEKLTKRVQESKDALDRVARSASTAGDDAQSSASRWGRLGDAISEVTQGNFSGAFDKLRGQASKAGSDVGDTFDEAGSEAGSSFAGSLDDALGGKLGSLAKGGAILGGAAAIGAAITSGISANIDSGMISDRIAAGLGNITLEDDPGIAGANWSSRIESVSKATYRAGGGADQGEAASAVGSILSSIEGATAWDNAALQQMSRDALNLSDVFSVDVAQSAQVAGQMIKLGLADSGAESMDMLTTALQSVPENLRGDMLDAIEEYAPHLQSMGYTGAEAFSILASSAELGQYGIDKAGDAMKELNIRATDGSTATVDAYEAMGLSAGDMANKILAGGESARGAYDEIIDGLLSITDPAEQAEAAVALLGTPVEDLTVQQIPEFLSSLGGVDAAFSDMDGAAAQLDSTLTGNLGSAIETSKRQFAGMLQDSLTPFTEWIFLDAIPGLQTFWADTMEPVFSDIGELVDSVWTGTLEPIFTELIAFIADEIGPKIQWLWEDIVAPAFGTIGSIIGAVIGNVVMPLLGKLWDFISTVLGPVIDWLWKTIIEPAFTAIGTAVTGFWEVARPALDAFKRFLDGDIAGALESLKDAVGNAFTWIANTIGNVVRIPVNFLIETVYNKGIVGVVNAIADALGLNWSLKEGTPIPPFGGVSTAPGRGSSGGATAVRARAKGGYTPPGWTLVGEEGPELVDMRTPSRVYTATETAAALALGRDLDPITAKRAAGASPDQALAPMGGNVVWDAVAGVARVVGDAIGGAVSWVRGGLADMAEFVLRPVGDLIAGATSGFGSLGAAVGGAGHKTIDDVVAWVRGQDATYNAALAAQGVPTGMPVFNGAGSGARSRPMGGPITSYFGPRWGSFHAGIDLGGSGPTFAAMDGVVSKIGWNAVAGRTGIGMVLNHGDRGWSYYGHNPTLNLPVKQGQHVRAGQHVGWGGATGNVTGPHLHYEWWPSAWGKPANPLSLGIFDQGGILGSGDYALNLSNRPERILSPQETEAFERLVAQLTGDSAAAAPTYQINVPNSRATAKEIVDEIHFAVRRFGGAP